MRRLTITMVLSAVALSACTQSVGQAVGELTRGRQGGAVYTPTAPAQPAPQQQAAAKPTPPPAPVAQTGEKGGFHLPRLPGLPRRDTATPAAEKSAPQPKVASAAPAAPAAEHHFLGFGGFPLVKDKAPPPTELALTSDPTPYRAVTLEGLARGVKDNSLPLNLPIEITADVDARFNRQIVIDLRGGGGLAVSRREGDCIQVLLPFPLDQANFSTGHYLIKGIYRRQWMPVDGFMLDMNRYEAACGDAYLFVRSIVHTR
jgi:hypothetical protein